MGNPLAKLASLGSPSLFDARPELSNGAQWAAGTLAAELASLLGLKNGFYAFESALHVFPASRAPGEPSLDDWNAGELWRADYGSKTWDCLFFAEDLFGVQFCIRGGRVFSFDPETGELSAVAEDLEGWAAAILSDYRVLTGYPLAHRWQQLRGTIPQGYRLVPRVPFVCGGELELENLAVLDAVKGMKARAHLARQIDGMPDGTAVEFQITG